MSNLIIQGGYQLKGEIYPVPNKNSILPIICACVLVEGPVNIKNVPLTTSVRTLINIFEQLGGSAQYLDNNEIILDSTKINSYKLDSDLAGKERASLMFLGGLTSRFGKAETYSPGGCKLGTRPVDTLLQGLKELGAIISGNKEFIINAPNGLVGNDNIILLEASVTGTENLIIAAVKAEGRTIIYNAASEPHVQDMCNFLVACGAKIDGIGTNKLIIDGVQKLSATEWTIISEHIDIGSLIVATCLTHGEVMIHNAIPSHMKSILQHYGKLNLRYKWEGESLLIPSDQDLKCLPNAKGDMDKIIDYPWPNYPADLIPQAIVLACAIPGNMRIHSTMYETQLFFIEELNKLNGKAYLANPHTVVTMGPSQFRSGTVTAPSIIQCAQALALVGFATEGETKILNFDPIIRRDPDLVGRYTSLGAKLAIQN